jgi:hypothetical protein
MADGNTSNGSTFWIGTTVAASDQSGFEADTYTQVGGVVDLGELGDEAAEVTSDRLSENRTRKFKGTRNAGTIAVVVDYIDDDAGQAAMDAAEATDFNYNFYVELNDAASGDTNGSRRWFRGKIMSEKMAVGGANNMVRVTYNIGIDSAIVAADAA